MKNGKEIIKNNGTGAPGVFINTWKVLLVLLMGIHWQRRNGGWETLAAGKANNLKTLCFHDERKLSVRIEKQRKLSQK